jgi:hypothetical protein
MSTVQFEYEKKLGKKIFGGFARTIDLSFYDVRNKFSRHIPAEKTMVKTTLGEDGKGMRYTIRMEAEKSEVPFDFCAGIGATVAQLGPKPGKITMQACGGISRIEPLVELIGRVKDYDISDLRLHVLEGVRFPEFWSRIPHFQVLDALRKYDEMKSQAVGFVTELPLLGYTLVGKLMNGACMYEIKGDECNRVVWGNNQDPFEGAVGLKVESRGVNENLMRLLNNLNKKMPGEYFDIFAEMGRRK